MSKGQLYLIPTVISEKQTDVIPEQVRQVVKHTDYFLVENLRTARRFISSLKLGLNIEELHFEIPQVIVNELAWVDGTLIEWEAEDGKVVLRNVDDKILE